MSEEKAKPPPIPPKPSAKRRSSGGTSTLPPALPPRDVTHVEVGDRYVSHPTSGEAGRMKDKALAIGSSPPVIGTDPFSRVVPLYSNAQDYNALKLASASELELEVSGKPMPLREFSKGMKQHDFPCLVKVADGHHSMCEYYSFGQEQMFVVLEKKCVRVAKCKDPTDGSIYAIPVNTKSFELTPHWMDTEQMRPSSLGKITAQELLWCKTLPPAIAVSGEFTLSERSERTVPIGTLLFPIEETKQTKDKQQPRGVLLAKSESGEMVNITPDCKGRFSILASDVRLSLQEALNHLTPPFTMRTTSDCDTVYVNIVTVESVQEEDILIGMMKVTGGTTVEDVASFSRIAEVPVNLSLTVVTMVPKEREILDHIYDYAHTGYYGVMRRPTMDTSGLGKAIALTPNPSYMQFSKDRGQMKPIASADVMPSGQPAKQKPPIPMARKPTGNLSQRVRVEHIYDSVNPEAVVITADAFFTSSKAEAPITTSNSRTTTSKGEIHSSKNEALTAKDEVPTSKNEALTAKDEVPTSKNEALTAKDEVPTSKNEALAPVEDFTSKDEAPASNNAPPPSKDEVPTTRDEELASTDDAATSKDEAETSSDSATTFRDKVLTSTANAAASKDESLSSKDANILPALEVVVPVSSACKDELPIAEHEEVQKATDDNIAFLKTMQRADILKLLDAMNLSVYKDTFDEEQIDGDIMACLSDEMLIELGVSKSLHRLRLMKIVSGQTSVKAALQSASHTQT